MRHMFSFCTVKKKYTIYFCCGFKHKQRYARMLVELYNLIVRLSWWD